MTVPRDSQSGLLDPSRKAADHLNTMLEEALEVDGVVMLDPHLQRQHNNSEEPAVSTPDTPHAEQQVAKVDDVRQGAQLIEQSSERDSVRLLLVTKNASIRQLGSLAQKRLIEMSKIFSEIHVLILNEFTEHTTSAVRLADNVWLYSTDSKSWWRTAVDAYRIATTQLIFAGVFRADVVVAEDPFESGAVAYALSQKYRRPFQIHLLEDIYASEFKDRDEHNGLRLFCAPFVIKRADSIRTSTEYLRAKVVDAFPELADDTEVLPVYHNLEAWKETVPSFDLKARYSRFNFIILHVSEMQSYSHTSEVIHGVAPILRNHPTIGLVIIGNGPFRPALEKQAIALGIQSHVEFEPVPDEVISHMKSANILVHLSENAAEDMTVLEAATVRLPILGATTNVAGSLFKDGDSAYICDGADPACVSQKLKLFLKDNAVRTQFALNAQEIVFDRIEQDYTGYLHAYRSSIERGAA